jgi:hypothetical protein
MKERSFRVFGVVLLIASIPKKIVNLQLVK